MNYKSWKLFNESIGANFNLGLSQTPVVGGVQGSLGVDLDGNLLETKKKMKKKKMGHEGGDIEGEGDIIERLAGLHGCSLEEFQANSTRCTENEVVDEDYIVSYEGVPRPGWRFVAWRAGTACAPASVAPYCEYNVGQALVAFFDDNYPDLVLPATTAVLVKTVPSGVLESTVTTMSAVSLCPWDKLPTFQTTSNPTGGATVPWLAVADL